MKNLAVWIVAFAAAMIFWGCVAFGQTKPVGVGVLITPSATAPGPAASDRVWVTTGGRLTFTDPTNRDETPAILEGQIGGQVLNGGTVTTNELDLRANTTDTTEIRLTTWETDITNPMTVTNEVFGDTAVFAYLGDSVSVLTYFLANGGALTPGGCLDNIYSSNFGTWPPGFRARALDTDINPGCVHDSGGGIGTAPVDFILDVETIGAFMATLVFQGTYLSDAQTHMITKIIVDGYLFPPQAGYIPWLIDGTGLYPVDVYGGTITQMTGLGPYSVPYPYVFSTGKPGGQTVYGGTQTGQSLTLASIVGGSQIQITGIAGTTITDPVVVNAGAQVVSTFNSTTTSGSYIELTGTDASVRSYAMASSGSTGTVPTHFLIVNMGSTATVFDISDTGDVTVPGSLFSKGTLTGFYNVGPVVQAGAIASPVGGTVIDTQARTAIDAIRVALYNIGITAP